MGLRYRLFLWVSGLFVLTAAISSVLENRAIAKELAQAVNTMRVKIEELSEQRRLAIQRFVGGSIAEQEVKIDAVLSNILRFSPQALRFAPTASNLKEGTWGDCANLLLEYKWIEFLQNTADNHALATLQPQADNVAHSFQIKITEDLFWVYCDPSLPPYLGIRVPYFLKAEMPPPSMQEVFERVPGEVPVVVFLFDVKQMSQSKAPLPTQALWPSIPVKWTEGYAFDVQAFAKSFSKAKEALFDHTLTLPTLKPQELMTSPAETPMENMLEKETMQFTQVDLLWIWVAFFNSGVFGKDLFTFPSPSSIAVFSKDHARGIAIKEADMLLPSAAFDDALYYKTHAAKEEGSGLASSLALIPLKESLFLANTAQFVVEVGSAEKKGYLTLGIDIDELLKRWLPVFRQTTLLIHDKKIFSAYQEGGEKILIETPFEPFLAQMLSSTSGLIPWKGQNYFYSHLTPISGLDLHLILLNPEAKEFAFLDDLESGTKEIAAAILFSIHMTGFIALLIMLILLHRISKKITEPIIELAEATGHVAGGHFDQIQLNPIPLKGKDEVTLLHNAFSEMIVDLREKEKMKGVLNKVVSPEIAQEILKGNVHLGGEEKKVTVLFADIRQFTHMTQHLPASEVIELLNVCMTKLSSIVDQHHGVIDKYVGDEVMALFGAPLSHGKDSLHAILSALEMLSIISAWNQERLSQGTFPIEIGIGIHTGPMLAGNMGAENRLNYTVIGSNVNLAARLCSAARGMEILISQDTLDEVQAEVTCEAVPPLTLKGFDKPVPVYRVRSLLHEPIPVNKK
jgi:class 3 adenylate cyclase